MKRGSIAKSVAFLAIPIAMAAFWLLNGGFKSTDTEVVAGSERPAEDKRASLPGQPSRAKRRTLSRTAGTAAPSTSQGSGPSARFKNEPLDQEWATAQEKAMSDRLDELDNPFVDPLGIECQSTCCKMSFGYEYLKDYGDADAKQFAYNAVQMDLQSSVGFGSWSNNMEMGGADFYACFDRARDTAELQSKGSIRLDERKRLLSESMPALIKCLPKAEHSAVVNVLAVFHEEGTVTVKKRKGDREVKTCVAAIVRQWQTIKGETTGFVNLPLILTRD